MEEENKDNFVKCDGLSYDMFKKITQYIDGVGSLSYYQTPNEAKSYFKSTEDLSSFINMLIEYQSKEKWRVKSENAVKFSQTENSILINGVEYFDFDLCLAIPVSNSVFLVPGEKTIESGVSPAIVLRLTNMYAYRPVLLSLHDTEDGDNNVRISFDFVQLAENKGVSND